MIVVSFQTMENGNIKNNNQYGLRNRDRNIHVAEVDGDMEEGDIEEEDNEGEEGQRPQQRRRVDEEYYENPEENSGNDNLEEPEELNFEDGGAAEPRRNQGGEGIVRDGKARQDHAADANNQGRGGWGRGGARQEGPAAGTNNQG